MKFKKSVEAIVSIICIIAGCFMTYDVEISIIPFLVGGTIFYICCALLSEYGRLFDYLENKLGKFIGL